MRRAWRVIGMAVAAGMLTASAAACGAGSGGDAPANGLAAAIATKCLMSKRAEGVWPPAVAARFT